MRNVEIKAHCSSPDTIRDYLKGQGAAFKGNDHQIDTYFKVAKGRLKLRQGTIENNLIHYSRDDQSGPKLSNFSLTSMEGEQAGQLHSQLTAALGILAVVDKRREIYYLNNIKFHIDQVDGLGSFTEIEVIDESETLDLQELHEQCNTHMNGMGIRNTDLCTQSYSDMILRS